MLNTTFKFGFRPASSPQTFALTGATLYGYWMRVDDNDGATTTSIEQGGQLIYGDPPKWFRGIGSYGASADPGSPETPVAEGLAIITDRTEGGAADYGDELVTGAKFDCTINGTSITSIGINGILNLEGMPFPGRYFARTSTASEIEEFRTDPTKTFHVEVTVRDDSATTEKLFTTAFVPGRMLDDMTRPMGQSRPVGMYRNIVR
jgi:hypothetical protein